MAEEMSAETKALMMNGREATPLTKPRHWIEVMSAISKPNTNIARVSS